MPSACLLHSQACTLSLIYAGIDIVASIEAKSESTKTSFTSWADSYLLPASSLGCKSLELYAARCGIIHTSTAESTLSRGGNARMIYYSWGSGETGDLSSTVALMGKKQEVVVVHVGQLLEAFRLGVLKWSNEVAQDSHRLKHVEAQRSRWFVNMQTSTVKDFLDNHAKRAK